MHAAAGWAILLGAGLVYVTFHVGALPLANLDFQAPWPQFCRPGGGAAPWFLIAGALAGGVGVARRLFGQAPFAVRMLLGSFLCLALSAQAVEVVGLALGRALFRPWIWALAAWVLAIPLLWSRWRSVVSEPRRLNAPATPADPLRRWLVCVALAVVALYGLSLGRTIRNGPRNWDGQAYHLPVPLQWLHLSSLTEPLRRQAEFGYCCDDTFAYDHFGKFAQPGNGHALLAVPLLLGWDRLACLAQVPFLLVAVWAVFSLARTAGATRASALLGALAFASAPMLAEQAMTPMLDLATAALSLTAVAFLLASAEESDLQSKHLASPALLLGLGLGTKLTALFPLPLAVLACVTFRRLRPFSARLGPWLIAAMLFAVPAAYWLVRSAALFGNPLYPMALSIAGRSVLQGLLAPREGSAWDADKMGTTNLWDTLLLPFRDPELNDETGFGALLVALAALGLAATVRELVALAGRRPLTPRGRLALMTACGLAIAWFATARTPRFSIHVLGVLAAVGATAIDGLGRRLGRHLVGVWTLALALFTLWFALGQSGWDVGPPVTAAADRQAPFLAVPPEIDGLPAAVIFNDTLVDHTSQPANYRLFGADHRHLVYDHPAVASDDGDVFVSRLRQMGSELVFLRAPTGVSPPPRYDNPELQLLLTHERPAYWSRIYRLDADSSGSSHGRVTEPTTR